MRLFLDANILVAVLNREYPLFTYAARVLSLCDDKRYEIYTSPLCLAIAFYFAGKKSGNKLALSKRSGLASRLHVAPISEECVIKAISNKKISDFEDGLEYYAAESAGCQVIITEDRNDFYFSELRVMGCEEFLSGRA